MPKLLKTSRTRSSTTPNHHRPPIAPKESTPSVQKQLTRRFLAGTCLASAILGSLSACGPSSGPLSGDTAVVGLPTERNQHLMQQALRDLYTANGHTVELTGKVLVLEDTANNTGAQICQTVAESYPPQCSGPRIKEWSWDSVRGEENANGVTWLGGVTLTGTFKDGVFTMSKPPQQQRQSADGVASNPGNTSHPGPPCRTPDSGWPSPDPAKASEDDLSLTVDAQYADRRDGLSIPEGTTLGRVVPGFAGEALFYVDKGGKVVNPTSEAAAENTGVGLTMYMAGDVAAATGEFRKTWGGPLCVVKSVAGSDTLDQVRSQVNHAFTHDKNLSRLNLSTSSVSPKGIRLSVLYGKEVTRTYFKSLYSDMAIMVDEAFSPVQQRSSAKMPATSAPADSTHGGSSESATSSKSFTLAVLEDTTGSKGAIECDALTRSDPPQCDGMPITNWDWAKVPRFNQAQGVQWTAPLRLEGVVTNGKLTLSRPPAAVDSSPAESRPGRSS